MLDIYANGTKILTPDDLNGVVSTVDLVYGKTWRAFSYDKSANGGLVYAPAWNRISIFPIALPSDVKIVKLKITPLADIAKDTKVGYYFLTANDFNIANSMLSESDWCETNSELNIPVPIGAKYMGFCCSLSSNTTEENINSMINASLLVTTTIGEYLKSKNGKLMSI